jgi:hypothetical protein
MKKYRGVTFIETVVAIGIFAVVMLGTSVFFARMWEINSFTYEIGIASFVASRGVDEAAQNIRKARPAENGAFAIEYADDDEITFFMDYDYDGVAERIHYFVADEKFQMGVREPDMTVTPVAYAAGDEIVMDAANYIVNEAEGYATFEYYGDDGEIYSYADVEESRLTLPIDTGEIKMIKILLFVNPDPVRKPNNVRIQSFIVIRNLTYFCPLDDGLDAAHTPGRVARTSESLA